MKERQPLNCLLPVASKVKLFVYVFNSFSDKSILHILCPEPQLLVVFLKIIIIVVVVVDFRQSLPM